MSSESLTTSVFSKSNAISSRAHRWRHYRRELESADFGRNLRIGAAVLFTINSMFIFADLMVYPDRFIAFLYTRLALDLLLIVAAFHVVRHMPVLAGMLATFGGSVMLTIVIAGTGGSTSDYYPGLMLLLLGAPVLVPFSPRQTCWLVGLPLAAFFVVAFPGLHTPQSLDFALRTFFLVAAGFMGVVSSTVLDRIRFSDFEQKRALERATHDLQELDQAKSRFTANVHHELRTPLTLVLSPLDAMLSGAFGEVRRDLRGHLRTMQVNALRLLKLINDLLDLAKAEQRQMRLRHQEVDARRIIEDVVLGFQPLAERKRVAIKYHGRDLLPLIADPDAVERIVTNLIANAVKFTNAGGMIEVLTDRVEAGVRLSVRDTGIGIHASDLERIFDRFAQGDSSATRRFDGSGIGLALVKELVELHGGRVRAESPGAGLGSVFSVWLPDREAPTQREGSTRDAGSTRSKIETAVGSLEAELCLDREAPDPSLANQRPYTEQLFSSLDGSGYSAMAEADTLNQSGVTRRAEILIVEDNHSVRRLLVQLLAPHYSVREAQDGNEALRELHASSPDLILTDVMMPVLSGIELCRRVKGDEKTRSIPLVLITSKAEREAKIEGLNAGADDYVTKPFHPLELLARVRALLRMHQLQIDLDAKNRELVIMVARIDAARRETELFARAVSHDLRSPITAASESLRVAQSASGHRVVTFMDLARTNLDSAERMLVGLREMTRAVGEFEELAPLSPREVAEEVVQELDAVHRSKTVAISIVGDSDCTSGHRIKLAHVFRNLIQNAVRHASTVADPQVVVEFERGENEVRATIRDNGTGIPQELRKRIFEPFFKAPEATTEGLGLGLALVQQIVSLHGGRVWFESEVGRGTAFHFTIPILRR